MKIQDFVAAAAISGSLVLAQPGTIGFAQTATAGSDAGASAKSELKDGSGRVVGDLQFTDTANGLLIRATLSGVPAGVHAMHLHAIGRCEGPSFESAGGHFNPTSKEHGYLDARGPHAGDLPNIYATAAPLRLEVFLAGVRLRTGPAMLLDGDGAAVVVHAGTDDYRSEPAGDAGKRLACGVIVGT